MKKRAGKVGCVRAIALGIVAALATLGTAVTARPAGAQSFEPPSVGAVYTQNNAVPNSVQVYRRSFTGALTPAGSVLTGGNGAPGMFAPQGAVTLHRSNRILFTVNGGTNTITSFLVRPDYGLTFASQVPSGGVLPASVTSSGNLVYVLNGASGNISGFTANLITGVLTSIPNSTRSLAAPAAPAQISFDTVGRTLAVTERRSDAIETFSLGFDNLPGAPVVHPSNGRTPYGFAFTARNHMIVSNAGAPPNNANDSSVSSYSVAPFVGTFTPVDTEPIGQVAACWVAVTPDARFAFVSNAFGKHSAEWGSLQTAR